MSEPSSTTKMRGRKTDRKTIVGTDHWQIDPQGRIYYNRVLRSTAGHVSLIDLGSSARAVPILPAYDDGSHLYFVDELVCWHFVQQIRVGWQRFVHMVHIDGDWSNNAANNLCPLFDSEWANQNESLAWAALAADDIPASRIKTPGAARIAPSVRRRDSAIDDLPAAHEVPVPAWVQYRRAA